jgi:hypothetical protein
MPSGLLRFAVNLNALAISPTPIGMRSIIILGARANMPRIAVTTLGENCSLELYHQAT